jgi:GH25 family lysozyme M1 (1,4-beta-N-acetylmuramidase)
MQNKTFSNPFGIDVSHYQGTIDWAKVKAAGVRFVYMKATESTGYVDPMLKTYVAGARGVGLPIGFYHFARPNADATAQADFFVNTIKSVAGDYGDLIPVLDLEEPADGSGDINQIVKWASDFITHVQQLTGKQVMMYTGGWFVNQYNGLHNAFSSLPLWMSAYRNTAPSDCGGWTSWTVWQYSDKGTVDGISGNVDVNVAVSLDAILAKPALSVINATVSHPTLRQGDSGAAVTELQTDLTKLGFDTKGTDGKFGLNTASALAAFQKANGLTADSVCGPQTWAKLGELLKPKYTVYQYENKLGDFTSVTDAENEAKKWDHASVRQISDGTWVWNNYPGPVYDVYQNNNKLQSFLGINPAIDYAKKYDHSYVKQIKDASVVWLSEDWGGQDKLNAYLNPPKVVPTPQTTPEKPVQTPAQENSLQTDSTSETKPTENTSNSPLKNDTQGNDTSQLSQTEKQSLYETISSFIKKLLGL